MRFHCLVIQPRTDLGRLVAAGGHANYGFSGYFKGSVYLTDERRKLADRGRQGKR